MTIPIMNKPSLKAYQFSPELKLVGRMTRAQRRRTFNQLEAIRRKYEISVRYNFQKIFKRQRNEVLKLEDPDIYDVFEAVHSTDNAMLSTLWGLYTSVADEIFPMVVDSATLKRTWDDYDKKAARGEEDFYQVQMNRWIRENAGTQIRSINDTTLREIQQIMLDTESLLEFREGISRIFEYDIIPNRSSMIARTETVAASNRAALETVKSLDSPQEEGKTWQTVMDADVRDSHMHMQGVTVGLRETFTWTGKHGPATMDVPADGSHGAPAGEIINCRCWPSFDVL